MKLSENVQDVYIPNIFVQPSWFNTSEFKTLLTRVKMMNNNNEVEALLKIIFAWHSFKPENVKEMHISTPIRCSFGLAEGSQIADLFRKRITAGYGRNNRMYIIPTEALMYLPKNLSDFGYGQQSVAYYFRKWPVVDASWYLALSKSQWIGIATSRWDLPVITAAVKSYIKGVLR